MERYLFFNSQEVDGKYDREYQASDFADYFGSVLSTGLIHTNEEPGMSVSVEQGTLNTVVQLGKAIIKGHLYENTSELTLEHPIPESNADRIDRIVLRLDLRNQSRFIKLFVKEGVSSSSPEAPTLQRDNYIHELSLAQVRVRANTSSLEVDDLKDERLFDELCGIVQSMISLPTEQFQREWDAFMDSVKDEGYATIKMVDEIIEDYVRSPGYASAEQVDNVYNIELNPAPTEYKDGMGVVLKAKDAGIEPKINVNGLGERTILQSNGLEVSNFKPDTVYTMRYNGTNFILQGEGCDEDEILETTIDSLFMDKFINYVDDTYFYAVGVDEKTAYKMVKSNGTITKRITGLNSNKLIRYDLDSVIYNRETSTRNYYSIYNENGTLIVDDTSVPIGGGFSIDGPTIGIIKGKMYAMRERYSDYGFVKMDYPSLTLLSQKWSQIPTIGNYLKNADSVLVEGSSIARISSSRKDGSSSNAKGVTILNLNLETLEEEMMHTNNRNLPIINNALAYK